MHLEIILCKIRQKNHVMMDFVMYLLQHNLCDHLGEIHHEDCVRFVCTLPEDFLNRRLLLAALSASIGSVLHFLFLCYHLWGPPHCDTINREALLFEPGGGDIALLHSLPIVRFHEHFHDDISLAVHPVLYLLCVSPKAYLKRPLNLICSKILLALSEVGWVPVCPFHFRD